MERTGNLGGIRPDDVARRAVIPPPPTAKPAAGPAAPAAPADAAGLGASTALEAQGGPRGNVAMPAGPRGADAADFDGFEGFGAPAMSTAEARAFVQDSLRALDGPPAAAAQAAASLLGDPRKFAEALGQLKALRGTPEGAAVKAELDVLAAKTTPALLAAKLDALADPAALPPATLTQLGRLRAVADPALQAALDRTAAKLLPGLTPERLVRDEALAALVAPLAASADPQAKAALTKKVGEWTAAAMDRALAGKSGPDGARAALQAFEAEIIGLARATGLGPVLQGAADQVLQQRAPEIEKMAKPKEKKGFWGKVTGAVSGLVEGVGNAIGNTLKFAVDGIGKVAKVAIDVTAKVSTVGLDLAAAGLDAVGADGAAAAVRKADRMVEKAYAAVGDQVQLFAEGVGSAFRDTVTGLSSTIAHPIDTVKGIAHLVTHPGEIPQIAKALWDTATEKGPAYALGYVAGNVLPMVLSGGSSSGGTLTARVAAIAGESRLVGGALKLASESRLVTGAVNASKAVAASRVGQVAARGYQAVAKVGGKVRTFTSLPAEFAGKLAARSPAIQKAASFVKAAAARFEASGPGRAVKRLAQAYEDKVVALNDLVDGGLRKTLKMADDAVLGAEKQALGGAKRAVADAAKVQRGARELTEADRKLLDDHGKSLDEVEDMNRRGLGKNKNPEDDHLVKAATEEADARLKALEDSSVDRNRKVYDEKAADNLKKVGTNRVEDGVIYQGARPKGEMPNVRVNYRNPQLKGAMDEAAKIAADTTLSAEQKLQRITDLVRGKDGKPGLLQAASTNDATDAWFNQFNAKMKGADYRLVDLDDYLKAGIGDCRHFAITNQTLLQELEKAIPGLNPRVVYTATFETVENGKALAVNHAFNVVTIKGEDIVVDSILPHMTGGKVKDYVEKGIFGREVRFLDDRFQTQAGRWIKGGENVGTAFNTEPAPYVAAGQLQNAQEERR